MRTWARFAVLFFVTSLASAALIGCGSGSADDPADASLSGEDAATSDEPPGGAPNYEQMAREAEARRLANLYPEILVKTTLGEFTLKLDRNLSEATVENFLRYVGDKFYDQTLFHQVEKGFIIAAGGYSTDLNPLSTRLPVRNEAENGLKNKRATVAMIRHEQIDSATSQFFINLKDNPALDHKSREVPANNEPDGYGYCVFGEVIDGWEVIEKIAESAVAKSGDFQFLPKPPIVIESIRRVK